jgi:hypothetical protein
MWKLLMNRVTGQSNCAFTTSTFHLTQVFTHSPFEVALVR